MGFKVEVDFGNKYERRRNRKQQRFRLAERPLISSLANEESLLRYQRENPPPSTQERDDLFMPFKRENRSPQNPPFFLKPLPHLRFHGRSH